MLCLGFCLDVLDMHGWVVSNELGISSQCVVDLDLIRQNSITGHVSLQGGWDMYITCVPRGCTNTTTSATLGALSLCEEGWCLDWVVRKAPQRRQPGRCKLLSEMHWIALVYGHTLGRLPS